MSLYRTQLSINILGDWVIFTQKEVYVFGGIHFFYKKILKKI